jgi:hypothetical protein
MRNPSFGADGPDTPWFPTAEFWDKASLEPEVFDSSEGNEWIEAGRIWVAFEKGIARVWFRHSLPPDGARVIKVDACTRAFAPPNVAPVLGCDWFPASDTEVKAAT